MPHTATTNRWLLPLSWAYGTGVWVRNQLFDHGVLESRHYPLPVVGVGNIAVGGTGKTPHVEYLARLLSTTRRIAILSRGYKRRSHGYVLADSHSTARDIGDEPLQMKTKFPRAHVAVDANRREGIERLLSDRATRDTEVILLDDAFQHRYVRPGLNILLTDYHRPLFADTLLPAGRLRESRRGLRRADMVVVTKCPPGLSEAEGKEYERRLRLKPHQALFFTTMAYDSLQPMYCGDSVPLEHIDPQTHLLLVSGIAQPAPLLDELHRHTPHVAHLRHGDHHEFSKQDIERMNAAFAAMPEPKMAVTTEKDAARLAGADNIDDNLRHHLYMLPIRVQFLHGQQNTFDKKITDYVRQDSRNRILDQRKDDDKS